MSGLLYNTLAIFLCCGLHTFTYDVVCNSNTYIVMGYHGNTHCFNCTDQLLMRIHFYLIRNKSNVIQKYLCTQGTLKNSGYIYY